MNLGAGVYESFLTYLLGCGSITFWYSIRTAVSTELGLLLLYHINISFRPLRFTDLPFPILQHF
jgi:hypothetical protein